MRKSEIWFTLGRIGMDTLMIFGSLLLVYWLRMNQYDFFGLDAPTPFPFHDFLGSASNITAFLLWVFALQGRYRFGADLKFLDEIGRIFWSFSSGIGLILITFFFLQKLFFSRFIVLGFWVLGFLCLLFGRSLIRSLRALFYHLGKGRNRILILGNLAVAKEAISILQQKKAYLVVGTLSESKTNSTSSLVPQLGTFDDFETVLKTYDIDEVLFAMRDSTHKITPDLVRIAHIHGVRFSYIPDELGLDLTLVHTSTLENLPIIILRNTKLDGWGWMIKNMFDFLVSLFLIILLSPLLLFVALLVWLECPKVSFLYASQRVGKNGKTFPCYKFRSMVPDADKKKKELLHKNERKGGVLFKIENDPRITKLGHFLRKSSLDELPQLLNVLRGEMSLIGPRPHLPEEVNQYGDNDLRVLSIKPGITGFSQINGRSSVQFQDEIQYELFYIKNWSLWLDLVIFFKTIWIVLKRSNVS